MAAQRRDLGHETEQGSAVQRLCHSKLCVAGSNKLSAWARHTEAALGNCAPQRAHLLRKGVAQASVVEAIAAMAGMLMGGKSSRSACGGHAQALARKTMQQCSRDLSSSARQQTYGYVGWRIWQDKRVQTAVSKPQPAHTHLQQAQLVQQSSLGCDLGVGPGGRLGFRHSLHAGHLQATQVSGTCLLCKGPPRQDLHRRRVLGASLCACKQAAASDVVLRATATGRQTLPARPLALQRSAWQAAGSTHLGRHSSPRLQSPEPPCLPGGELHLHRVVALLQVGQRLLELLVLLVQRLGLHWRSQWHASSVARHAGRQHELGRLRRTCAIAAASAVCWRCFTRWAELPAWQRASAWVTAANAGESRRQRTVGQAPALAALLIGTRAAARRLWQRGLGACAAAQSTEARDAAHPVACGCLAGHRARHRHVDDLVGDADGARGPAVAHHQ